MGSQNDTWKQWIQSHNPSPLPSGYIQIHFHVHETLKKSQEKYNEMHDQHRVEKTFKVGDRVWLHLTKERLQGLGNNVKEL